MRPASVPVEQEAPRPTSRAWRLLVGRPDAATAERYAVAAALSVLAVALSLLIPRGQAPFRVLPYVAAAAVSALRGGVLPGLASVAMCAAAYTAFDGGSSTAWLEEPDPVHRVLFFVAFAALTVWGGGAIRDGYRHTHARRRSAEARADAQRIAAELGVRALAEGNLDALLSDTLAAVKRALRADSVTLLELQPDARTLQVRTVAGVGRALVGRTFGPEEAPLSFRALTAREALAVDDLAEEKELASPILRQNAIASTLVAPVLAPGPGGRSFGVIGAHSTSRRAFSSDEGAFLQTAANVVGTAVVRLRADEQARRTLATERFLAEASRQLALSIDWQQTVTRVARLALPFLGDWCLVVVADPRGGRARAVVAEASDAQRVAAVQDLLARYPIDLGAAHGVGRILRTGEPELIPEVTPDDFVGETNADSEVRREVLRRLGMLSYLGAPLRIGERVLGAIAFGVAEGTRRFRPEDLDVAQALAQRCAVALDNAGLYRAAQEATRAREQVLAVVSHDLKTPLGALLMGAEMVDRLAPPGMDGNDLRRAAVIVRRTAERMRRLIHDLVDAASIEAGGLSIAPAPHDPAAVAGEALEAVQDVADDRGIVLHLEAADLPPVQCDRDRILQVLSNLLTNAMHVSDRDGEVSLSVRCTGDAIVFRVADRGPGIPAEDLPHIFERWYRGGGARYPGSGLGLAIARTIVGAHGGSIWAESKEGEGSVFSFSLPRSFGPTDPPAS